MTINVTTEQIMLTIAALLIGWLAVIVTIEIGKFTIKRWRGLPGLADEILLTDGNFVVARRHRWGLVPWFSYLCVLWVSPTGVRFRVYPRHYGPYGDDSTTIQSLKQELKEHAMLQVEYPDSQKAGVIVKYGIYSVEPVWNGFGVFMETPTGKINIRTYMRVESAVRGMNVVPKFAKEHDMTELEAATKFKDMLRF